MDGDLEQANFIIRTYGCLVVGVLLIAVNFPVLWALLTNIRLRQKYRITAFLLLTSGLTGFLAALSGVIRFRYYYEGWGHKNVRSITCFYESVALWLIWINLLNGTNIFIMSIDRLVVVVFPGYYYKNANRLTKWLIICAFCTTVMLMAACMLVEIILPPRQISALCKEQEVFHTITYNIIEIVRASVAIFGILLMVGVLVAMKKRKSMMHITFTSRTTVKAFVNNQKHYTITTILFSSVTFFLFVLPTVYQLFLQLGDLKKINHLKLYAVFLSYLNAFNVAIVTVFRQKDIKFRGTARFAIPVMPMPISRDHCPSTVKSCAN